MLGMIINSPFRIFFFLASPLPWYWRGINDIIAFLFSAFFYTILEISPSKKHIFFIVYSLIVIFLKRLHPLTKEDKNYFKQNLKIKHNIYTIYNPLILTKKNNDYDLNNLSNILFSLPSHLNQKIQLNTHLHHLK